MSKKSINKRKKKIPFLYKQSIFLLTIISLFLIMSIIYLNILTIPLIIIASIIILLINYGSIFLILKSRIKILGFISSIILMAIYTCASFYIIKTTSFLDNLDLAYKTYHYSIVVNKDEYQELNKIKGTYGYLEDDSIEGTKAYNKLLKKIDNNTISYNDASSLVSALLDNEVEAILIENSYLEMLNENLVLEDGKLSNNISKLYNFDITINTNSILDDTDVTTKPFNVYISGIDTYGSIDRVSRSDVNMILSVNPKTKEILITSIPRDYYVKLHGKNGYRDKITHAGLYGIDTSIATIEDLLDIDINYYVKVNFSSIINIIDAIGGIEVYSDYTFTSRDNYNYHEGYNNLNGKEALSFARERKAFASGDRQRVKNQQAVFKALLDKVLSKEIIVKYTKLLDSVDGNFVTNMPMSRITSLVKMQISKNSKWNITMNSLEGSDGKDYTYSAPTQTAYVMLIDEDSVSYGNKLITNVIEGTKLTNDLMDNLKQEITGEEVITVNSYVKDNKLKAKLVRNNITMTLGSDYIYHGFIAIYDGIEVTNNPNLNAYFVINDKKIDNYNDLIWYITTSLNSGEYIINYHINYQNESVILNQKLIIKEN